MVYGDEVKEFVAKNIPGVTHGFGACQAIGFLLYDELIAGIVYHNWSPETGVIEMSAASIKRHWLTRDRLAAIFEYPIAIGCRLVVARTSERNTRAINLWRHLGAKEYSIPEMRGIGEAEIIHVLNLAEWQAGPYARPNDEQKRVRP